MPQHLTIKALTQYLKRKFDVDPHLQKVTVIGELSNFRERANSHQYFSLKDEAARISAVMYRNAYSRVPFKLEEGMKVIATGRVTLYEPSGSYQLVIETLEPDGVGALYLALEQLKQRFKEQGLLDLPRKALPIFPRKIAVITSPSGAVIRDILTTVKRRYPIVQITVFPTRVQGKEATAEIVRAFEQVEQLADEYDTVIVARGGGSIEDLWCFNEEAVAHAILRCSLPVIAAIGHETDTTLADLVADMRAPTPTAAAEMAVPVLVEVKHYLQQLHTQLFRNISQQIALLRKQQERLQASYVLKQPERLYQPYIQQLDRLNERTHYFWRRSLEQKASRLQQVRHELFLQQPTYRIAQSQHEVRGLQQQLNNALAHYLKLKQTQVAHAVNLLDAYSPLKIMARGYAVVQTPDQQVIKTIEALQVDQAVQVRLADGEFQAKVTEIQPN